MSGNYYYHTCVCGNGGNYSDDYWQACNGLCYACRGEAGYGMCGVCQNLVVKDDCCGLCCQPGIKFHAQYVSSGGKLPTVVAAVAHKNSNKASKAEELSLEKEKELNFFRCSSHPENCIRCGAPKPCSYHK